uniref:CYTH domain-containing protein n=1 Tax=Ditylenchus dipsaci TaxID=166011 RepID=A0A915EJS3_9BILA
MGRRRKSSTSYFIVPSADKVMSSEVVDVAPKRGLPRMFSLLFVTTLFLPRVVLYALLFRITALIRHFISVIHRKILDLLLVQSLGTLIHSIKLKKSDHQRQAIEPAIGQPPVAAEMSSMTATAVDATSTDSYKTVTLKARVNDLEQMEWALFKLTESIGHLRTSEDIYFDVPYGQMKLRINSPRQDHGELISYKQTNNVGPNFSQSRVTEVSHGVQRLRNTLALSLTELGTIFKKRRVFYKGNICIYLDEVENLGVFVDIDIHANDTKASAEELLKQAEKVQKALAIADTQLVPFSYFELYLKAKSCDSGFDEESTSDVSF